MAAHILTVLNEMLQYPDHWVYLQDGLGYAQFGDNLDYQDWRELNDACDAGKDEVIATCEKILPKYQKIWELLDKPANAEDWLDRRWSRDTGRKYKARLTRAGLR